MDCVCRGGVLAHLITRFVLGHGPWVGLDTIPFIAHGGVAKGDRTHPGSNGHS